MIDNLAAVPAVSFIDRDWTTEHYDYAGRTIIARNLCDTLKNYLKHNVR